MQIQNVVSVSRSNAALLSSGTQFLQVCDHVFAYAEYKQKIQNTVNDYLDANLPGLVSNARLDRCLACGTDFKTEIKEYGDDGLALVIAKWIDLGSGITPDPRWDSGKLRFQVTDLGAPELLGDARHRFEKAPTGESEDELLCHNFSYLFGEKY